jgi:hypothetical protein
MITKGQLILVAVRNEVETGNMAEVEITIETIGITAEEVLTQVDATVMIAEDMVRIDTVTTSRIGGDDDFIIHLIRHLNVTQSIASSPKHEMPLPSP